MNDMRLVAENRFYRSLVQGLIDQVNILIEDLMDTNKRIAELEAECAK